MSIHEVDLRNSLRDIRPFKNRMFDARTARKTLPFVRPILDDLVQESVRRSHWECASRRARSEATISATSEHPMSRQAARTMREELETSCSNASILEEELRSLGLVVLDNRRGCVGYPTMINGALAYFVYRLEDDDLSLWRYRNRSKLRPIPKRWFA